MEVVRLEIGLSKNSGYMVQRIDYQALTSLAISPA